MEKVVKLNKILNWVIAVGILAVAAQAIYVSFVSVYTFSDAVDLHNLSIEKREGERGR